LKGSTDDVSMSQLRMQIVDVCLIGEEDSLSILIRMSLFSILQTHLLSTLSFLFLIIFQNTDIPHNMVVSMCLLASIYFDVSGRIRRILGIESAF